MPASYEESERIHRICKKWRAQVGGYRSWLRCRKDSALKREQFCGERGLDGPAFCYWVGYIEQEDKYSYYASLAPIYLQQARRTLDLLERYFDKDPDLRMPLMRDAIVSYAALFTDSKGRVPKNLKLTVALVPDTLRDTHDRICERRNVIIAHCDLRLRDPHVVPFGIMLKGVGLSDQDYLQLLAPFKALIDAVQANVESHRKTSGLAASRIAFEHLGDPPPAALEDPGKPSG